MTESSVYLMVQVKCGGEKSQLSQVGYFERQIDDPISIKFFENGWFWKWMIKFPLSFGIGLFRC